MKSCSQTHPGPACSVATACLFGVLAAVPVWADSLTFCDIFSPTFDDGSIRRVSTSGGTPDTLVTTGGGLRSLDIDAAGGKVYWVDVNNFVIRRANLDGSGQEDVVTSGLAFPSCIRVDAAGGKIYWGDQTNEEIRRADLDGANNEQVKSTLFHRGLAIDSAAGKIYWSTSLTPTKGDIRRADLDGSNEQTVVSSVAASFKPNAIALDVAGGKVYWTDFVLDVVSRANLDGTNVETLYPVGTDLNPRGITLDLAAGKVYWGQDVDPGEGPPAGKIMRMDLDGANPADVLSGLGLANDVVFSAGGAACEPCDVNCDGSVNPFDINGFLAALSGAAGCSPCAGDANADGTVNPFDINAFLVCMGG